MFSLCLLWSDDFVFLVKHSSHSCGTALALAGMATLEQRIPGTRAQHTNSFDDAFPDFGVLYLQLQSYYICMHICVCVFIILPPTQWIRKGIL